MRHRKRGRVLGRSPSHRKAMLRNLAKSLILTEDPLLDDLAELDPGFKPPKVRGRVITTLHKAKEVRPLVEKCITIARKGREAEEKADAEFGPPNASDTQAWQDWRKSEQWQKWTAARAPGLYARRRILALLAERGFKDSPGDKRVVRVLFDVLAPRFADRPGGYTRILKMAHPRLGDAGKQAILEFVGVNDRVKRKASAPAFEADEDETETTKASAAAAAPATEQPTESAQTGETSAPAEGTPPAEGGETEQKPTE